MIDAVVFQLAFIFLPGLIWSGIVDRLTVHAPRRPFDVIVRAFGFGIASYVAYFILYLAITRSQPGLFASSTQTPDIGQLGLISFVDVAFASMLALGLGVGWSASINHKLFIRAMQKLRVTRKYGDESIWDFTFNMGVPQVEYVYFRDFETKLIYSGWVKAFSESSDTRELLLENVEVYDLDHATKLFEAPLIYLCRNSRNIHIEFPYRA